MVQPVLHAYVSVAVFGWGAVVLSREGFTVAAACSGPGWHAGGPCCCRWLGSVWRCYRRHWKQQQCRLHNLYKLPDWRKWDKQPPSRQFTIHLCRQVLPLISLGQFTLDMAAASQITFPFAGAMSVASPAVFISTVNYTGNVTIGLNSSTMLNVYRYV